MDKAGITDAIVKIRNKQYIVFHCYFLLLIVLMKGNRFILFEELLLILQKL